MVAPPILGNKSPSCPSYAPPAEFAEADPQLVAAAMDALTKQEPRAVVGSSWTTDAPIRETAGAIEAARAKGIFAVEMEAAALYTFAQAAGARMLCLALSPTPWDRQSRISRRAKLTAHGTHSPFWRQSSQRCKIVDF